MERKLASILAADVAGFSRLVARDQEATLRMLAAYRAAMETGYRFYSYGDAMLMI